MYNTQPASLDSPKGGNFLPMHSGFASLYLIPYTMNLRVLILVIAFMC